MNFNKKLNKLAGSESVSFKINYREPYIFRRMVLTFKLEIVESSLKTYLGGDAALYILFNVKNRLIDDKVDDDDFEFYFDKSIFKEELKENIYEIYKIVFLGINEEDLIIEYNFI